MKLIITENKRNKVAIKWLNNNYGDLEPYETKDYFGSVFYKKGDDVIFEYNKNGYVYVSYDKICSFFEHMFSMEYKQIQDLTKEWIEEHYNLRVTKVLTVTNPNYDRWNHITS